MTGKSWRARGRAGKEEWKDKGRVDERDVKKCKKKDTRGSGARARATLTAMESTRLPSLRVVNNGDGNDNEVIYGRALAHISASTSASRLNLNFSRRRDLKTRDTPTGLNGSSHRGR